jgi:putative DNA primase/helicase
MRSDQQSASSPSPEIVSLQGRRFVVANEIEDGRRLNDKHLKILASNQAITARDMYSKPIDFMPQHKIWVTTNHRPTVTDQTDGAWRRLRILPFKNQVPQEKIDYHLESKLLEERSGILNWLIEGCQLWLKERLRPTKDILEASENYRIENDTIGAFIDECCVLGSGLTVTKKSIYRAYKAWCQDTSQFAFSQINFTKKLEVHGVSNYRTNAVRGYVGISLNSDFMVVPE